MSEYENICKEIIWNNQGISSYGLLEKLITEHKYKLNNDKFQRLLCKLRSCEDIRYDKEKDEFYRYRELNIKVMSKVKKCNNCLECIFRVDAKNAPYNEINSDLRKQTKLLEIKGICALNPILDIGNSRVGYLPSGCPLNKGIKDN